MSRPQKSPASPSVRASARGARPPRRTAHGRARERGRAERVNVTIFVRCFARAANERLQPRS
eukprot:6643044-Pyramimonas_sp.AAC.1